MKNPKKKAEKRLKRKKKANQIRLAELPKKIERRRMKNVRYQAYKMQVENNKKAINLKLKKALGIPEDEDVSTEKLVEAMNLRIKMGREKAELQSECSHEEYEHGACIGCGKSQE